MIQFVLRITGVLLLLLQFKFTIAQNCAAKALYYEKLDVPDVRPVIPEMKNYISKNVALLTADCSRRMNYLIAICYEITGEVDSAASYFNVAKQAASKCSNDTAIVETYMLVSGFYLRRNRLPESKRLLDTAYYGMRRYIYMAQKDYDLEKAPSFYVNLDDPIISSNNNAGKFSTQFNATQLSLLRQYYQTRGNYYLADNKPYDAKANLLLSYQFAKANPADSTEGNILNNLGLLLSNEGYYQRAVDFLNESLLISEKQKDNAAMVNTLLNLSFCYRKIKKIKDAETYAARAHQIAQLSGYSAYYCRASSFLARALAMQDKVKEAEQIMRAGIDTAKKYKLDNELAYNYRSLAEIMVQHNYKMPEVKTLAEKSRSMVVQLGDSSFLNATDLTLGNYYLKTNNYTKALQYTKQSMDYSYQFNDYAEIDLAYKQMADVYTAMNNYKMANTYLQKYEAVKDSLVSRELQLSMQDLERKYSTQSKLLKISDLEKDQKEKGFLLVKNKNRMWLFIYIAIATLLAAAIFFYFNRKLSRQKKELMASNEKLEGLTGLQNRLFRIIGHDLKSMIMPFSRAGKIMHNYLDKNETGNTVLYANKLEENAVRLSGTVNNLLFWSLQQLDGYQIKKELIDVRENTEAVLEQFEELIRLKGIHLINLIKKGEQLLIDKEGFQIILRNILSNAIKFTDKGSVTIFSATGNSSYTISVRDEGIGMDDKKTVQLFTQPLQQTTSGTRGEKGSGIGFSIVKKMVELNGGTVQLTSEKNKGTTVNVSFLLNSNKV
jgi:signal transduction histidine kinase